MIFKCLPGSSKSGAAPREDKLEAEGDPSRDSAVHNRVQSQLGQEQCDHLC